MGKKLQGAALRSKKRQQETVEELQEQHADRVAASGVVDEPNEALFVLDTDGAIVPRHERPSRLPRAAKKTKTGAATTLRLLSAKEKKQVEALLLAHTPQQLVKLVKEGKALLDQTRVWTHGPRADRTKKATYDLWGETDAMAAKPVTRALGSAPAGTFAAHTIRKPRQALKKAPKNKDALAVEVARSGQSYRPDPILHQQALRSALGVETRRQVATDYNETPLSQGMTAETKALIVGDTDSEEEEDANDNEMDADGESTSALAALHKAKAKYTRAQRNKQKRLRVEKAIHEKSHKRRKMENQVAEIPRYKKLFRKENAALVDRKSKVEQAKQATTRVKGSKVFEAASEANPIKAPTFPIGLTTEVQTATLRTIRPKGSLVTDRMISLRDRDLAAPVRGHAKIRKHKRRRAVKGKHNAGNEGENFCVLG
jgi:nucleolar protein 53